MVEVFKTNVANRKQAKDVMIQLHSSFPNLLVNFDLEDCDKILRIEGSVIQVDKILDLLISNGYQCEVLESNIKYRSTIFT